jgi:hypothetical protein
VPSNLPASNAGFIESNGDTEERWGGLLRDLATEPDAVVAPIRSVALAAQVEPAAREPRFGGLLDLLLVVAAVVTVLVVAAVGVAVFFA